MLQSSNHPILEAGGGSGSNTARQAADLSKKSSVNHLSMNPVAQYISSSGNSSNQQSSTNFSSNLIPPLLFNSLQSTGTLNSHNFVNNS
jgi:hypothetical protein